MKTNKNKLTTLSEDILQIVNTESQAFMDITQLSKDHKNPARLPDNHPVLNLTQDELLLIFTLNPDHYFLSPLQILRFGFFFRLSLPRLIALMLKTEWENFILKTFVHESVGNINFEELLKDSKASEKYLPLFKPDIGRYFELLTEIYKHSNEKVTYSKVSFIAEDLLIGQFLVENISLCKTYPEKDIRESVLLSNEPDSVREDYQCHKQLWIMKTENLLEFQGYLEQKKLYNRNVENDYFRNPSFCFYEMEKTDILCTIDKYRTILGKIPDNPEASIWELMRSAEKELLETVRKKNELTEKITRSRNYIHIPPGEGQTIFTPSYLKEVSTLLNKILFLTHPDTCPNYGKFSDKTKKQIHEIFGYAKVMKSNKENLFSFSPSMLLYHLPDYDHLYSVYKKVCKILNINPEHFEIGNRLELRIMIGKPVNELIEFLKTDIERIETQHTYLECLQLEYTNEFQTQYFSTALEDENLHIEKLKKEINELKLQRKEYKKMVINELNRVSNEQQPN